MPSVTYQIVEHDGGWAYRVEGTFSETLASHEAALNAARRAAREQRQPGETAGIEFEDSRGVWREEVSSGDDRPETQVEG
jgi:hypothetical protein